MGKRGPKPGYLEALESRIRILESVLTPEQWEIVGKLDGQVEREYSESSLALAHPEKKARIHEQPSSSIRSSVRPIPPQHAYDDLLQTSSQSRFPPDHSRASASSNAFQPAQHLGFGDLYAPSNQPTMSMGRAGSSEYLHASDQQEYHAPPGASAAGRDAAFDIFAARPPRRAIASSSYESMMMHSPLLINQEEPQTPNPLQSDSV